MSDRDLVRTSLAALIVGGAAAAAVLIVAGAPAAPSPAAFQPPRRDQPREPIVCDAGSVVHAGPPDRTLGTAHRGHPTPEAALAALLGSSSERTADDFRRRMVGSTVVFTYSDQAGVARAVFHAEPAPGGGYVMDEQWTCDRRDSASP